MDVYTSVVMAAIGRIIAVGAIVAGSFAAVLLTTSGCHSGFDWQGDWVGTRDVTVTPGTPPEIANSVKHVTLTVKTNGEYELHASGVPSSGIFHASGNQASLEPVSLLDRPAIDTTQIPLKANPDGTISLSSPDTLDSRPILLHRESQPDGSNVRNR